VRPQQRKSAPRVRDGKVQKKNRTALSPHYSHIPQERPAVDRQRPGEGHRHLLTKRHIYRFIDLLPDWNELSKGLNAIVLAPASHRAMGWHDRGIVALCAWPREIELEWDDDFIEQHQDVLDRLGVPCEPIFDDPVREWEADLFHKACRFTENSARGFQLMHVLLHELGHHHDRMNTRSQRRPSRGESFAEQYAARYSEQIWGRYFAAFGW
jgi:hypothetical protein